MIKTIIVDDIQNNRDVLQQLLTEYCPNVQICSFASNVIEAEIVIQNIQPDLVLLDIEMPPSNAFELLKKFPNPNFEVIFITAHNQYALRAIKFCALDYLLKPVDIQELKAAIDKVSHKIKTNQKQDYSTLIENIQNKNHQEHKIALPTLEGLIFVKVHQIIRCEADGSYTNIHLASKKILTATRKIKEFEQLLIEHNFFRVHRSHLINLDKIEKYYKGNGGYVLLSDGSNIDISRRKKDAFLEKLNRI
jgi:two-component system LytT family response regulator